MMLSLVYTTASGSKAQHVANSNISGIKHKVRIFKMMQDHSHPQLAVNSMTELFTQKRHCVECKDVL